MNMERLGEKVLQNVSLVAAFLSVWALTAAPLVDAQEHVLGAGQQTQQPAGQPQPDQTAPAAGGPSGDNGSIALPKKKDNPDDTPPPAPAEPKFKNPEGLPSMSLRVEVPEVTIDVGVLLEKTHSFVPGL